MINLAWLVPLLPLLGGLVAAFGGRWLRQHSHWPVVLGIGAAFLVAAPLLLVEPGKVVVYEWIAATDLSIPVVFRVDGLTSMMLAMVTFVATLIALFAAGYMAGDPGYPRFFACIGLFVTSMTGLVLSSNYVITYAFWEGVGVCSYLLIGFWHSKPSAAAAAKKAFMVNRLGDFGFAVALFWMWSAMPGHSLNYDDVLNPETLAALPHGTVVGLALLLFWAATAKSAQIPLYVWLPDAMEGPTPVSALIHAATMVTAGVYLIARSSPLVALAPGVQLTIAAIGCATALLSALIALTQTDLKRVLAYSTVSQLGFMFMGLGAGIRGVTLFAVVAALFHLFTHAFFKALLFLGSGSVMHAMGGVIDMRRFRGLRHRLPYTCMTFAVGGLALAGIPPLAGFFSKDEILAALGMAAHVASEPDGPGWGWAYSLIYWVAVLTAFLTAFYTGRAFFLTFYGPEKLPSESDPEAEPEAAAAAHSPLAPPIAHPVAPALPIETPAPETPQLAAYERAVGSRPMTMEAGMGREGAGEFDPHRPADLPTPTPGASDEPVPQDAAAHGHGHAAHGHGHGGHDDHFGHESPPIMTVPLMILAICAAAVGLVFGPTGLFEHHLEHTPTFHELGHAVEHGFDWMTALIGTLVGVAGLALSWWMYAEVNPVPGRMAEQLRPLYRASYYKFFVDEIYELLVVGPVRLLAMIAAWFDREVVDARLVLGTARTPRILGRNLLAPFQNGLIQFYAASTALGLVVLLLILLMT